MTISNSQQIPGDLTASDLANTAESSMLDALRDHTPDELLSSTDGAAEQPSLWQENHGSFLVALAAGVVIVGSIAMAVSGLQSASRAPGSLDGINLQLPQTDGDMSMVVLGAAGSNELSDTPVFSGHVLDAVDEGQCLVTLHLQGVEKQSGSYRIAVYDSTEAFNRPDTATLLQAIPVGVDAQNSMTFTADPSRPIAVAVYHDVNDDSQLNKNVLGIPLEPYGFSNNARKMTGPPSFQDAAVQLKLPTTEITVSVQ